MSRIFIFLIAMIISLTSVGLIHAGPVLWDFNGHLYDVILQSGINWDNARSAAQALGAGWDLATITSANEQTFIQSLLPLPNQIERSEFWLGGYQSPQSGLPDQNWHWVTGESWSYQNWGPGQPDEWSGDPAGGQYFLAMDSNGGNWAWDDNTGSLWVIRGYIVENHIPIPEPATMLLLGIGFFGIGMFSRLRRKRGYTE